MQKSVVFVKKNLKKLKETKNIVQLEITVIIQEHTEVLRIA